MEAVYQYLWKHSLAGDRSDSKRRMMTVDGRRVEVIYPGRHNTDAGPDFTGARLVIDNQEWSGNVEIHVKASDWFRHRHDTDPAYDNVILHVVGVNDTHVSDRSGNRIAQTVLTFPESFASLYARLSENLESIPCEHRLKELSPIATVNWLETLAVERIQAKSQRILDTVRLFDGDWERSCFVTLARALGFSLNSEPLEMLARSLPLSIASKHSDDLLQIEALLFGQAGMLDPSIHIFDEYYQRLCREYAFLAAKYGLKPMRREIWKFARTRPNNFPTRRIALLAKSLYGGFSLMSRIVEDMGNNEDFRALFDWELEGYWADHLDFGHPAGKLSSGLSPKAASLLDINLRAPLLYAYGAWRGDAELAERGLDVWRDTEAENNAIIRRWENAGVKCLSASDSQALLQLRKEYCDCNRCLECRFGHNLLRQSIEG